MRASWIRKYHCSEVTFGNSLCDSCTDIIQIASVCKCKDHIRIINFNWAVLVLYIHYDIAKFAISCHLLFLYMENHSLKQTIQRLLLKYLNFNLTHTCRVFCPAPRIVFDKQGICWATHITSFMHEIHCRLAGRLATDGL